MAGQTILVVDDERNIRELVRMYLEQDGYQVAVARDGAEALHQVQALRPALMILDLMLPEVDGWKVCRRVRASSDLPILMLTARDDDADKIVGLELGADDYLTKPFNPQELVARVRAILRHTGCSAEQTRPVHVGNVVIDPARRELTVDGQAVNPIHTRLILTLASLLLALSVVGMAAALSSSASVRGTTELASVMPADGEVTGPRDLFDMAELRNLTLADLQWTVISERVLPSGVTETIGSWSGGVWHTFDITGTACTITLSEQAAICWPPGYPNTPNSQAGFGHVFAAHEATHLREHADVGEELALAFGLPVLHHGEEAAD